MTKSTTDKDHRPEGPLSADDTGRFCVGKMELITYPDGSCIPACTVCDYESWNKGGHEPEWKHGRPRSHPATREAVAARRQDEADEVERLRARVAELETGLRTLMDAETGATFLAATRAGRALLEKK